LFFSSSFFINIFKKKFLKKMGNLSSKQVLDIQSLYEGIYQDGQESIENISEEDFCDILAIEICNALIEEGLLEGEVISETTIKEGKLTSAVKSAWGVIKPVIKQVTGIGTKPTTRVGRVIRTGQTLATGAAVVQPERTLNIATGTVGGAVKGAYQGATKPTGGGPIDAAGRAIKAAQGQAVPAADDRRRNSNGTTTWSTP